MLKGVPASMGYAIAPILKIDRQTIDTTKFTVKNIKTEIAYLHEAIDKTVSQLEALKLKNDQTFDHETSSIFDAHIAIAKDPEVIKQVEDKIIKETCNVAYAVKSVVLKIVDMFKDIEDEYLKQRASDLLEVSDRIIKNHLDIEMIDLEKIDHEVILAAHEITASEAAMVNPKYVLGFLSEVGGKNSHSSIIARLFGIPALVGVKDLMKHVKNDEKVILDAEEGKLIRSYTNDIESLYQNKITNYVLEKHKLESLIGVKPYTTDGHHVELLANIGSFQDVKYAKKQNAYGVGLFRTELIFLDRYELPSEDEQYHEYKKVLESFHPQPVTIRTLDIGGDKPLPYLKHQDELNPALGIRGIRFSLVKDDMLKTQLKALLRASIHGHLKIMFPMISTKEEFVKVKRMVKNIEKELIEDNINVGSYELGVMIEVPSAALIADQLASVVDFFSIGTNDLIQYTLAADRLNSKLEYLNQPYHLSILRLIHMVTTAAKKAKIKTAVCGEMASDPIAACLLIGLGVDELSMTSSSIVKVKDKILKNSYEDLVKLSHKILSLTSDIAVVHQLKKHIK
jgi:phosphotransferase system enzyme I (PtsI)